MEEVKVLIVGAGPSGLATSACLNARSVSNIILEREDCSASMWKKRTYDRLSLHLAKNYCTLPYKNYPPDTPTFMSKNAFITYIDEYVAKLKLKPSYRRNVESVSYDKMARKWTVYAKSCVSGRVETYKADFLVVATGENSEPFTPKLHGLESFKGEVIHSSGFRSGKPYQGKDVLVIGSGNSGMEISNDLADHDVRTTIAVRSQFHVLTKRMVQIGMLMAKWLPIWFVDKLISFEAKLTYGDLSKYGIRRPSIGPFTLKKLTGKTPVINQGTIEKIKTNKIKVAPDVQCINGDFIQFKDGTKQRFDAIIFATGYRNSDNNWLKGYKDNVVNSEGMGKKGENGVYCAGMSGNGLSGISSDATAIANHISQILKY